MEKRQWDESSREDQLAEALNWAMGFLGQIPCPRLAEMILAEIGDHDEATISALSEALHQCLQNGWGLLAERGLSGEF